VVAEAIYSAEVAVGAMIAVIAWTRSNLCLFKLHRKASNRFFGGEKPLVELGNPHRFNTARVFAGQWSSKLSALGGWNFQVQ
jgi:hypothetical protein